MYSTTQQSNRTPWVAIAGATLSAAASYWMYETVKEYGWQGALRYVWEGDAYGPAVREYLETLDKVAKSREIQEKNMSAIEEALERARLDSVDEARTTKAIVLRWVENCKPRNLENTLAALSDTLDKLAAQVDDVIVTSADRSADPRSLQEVKRRKKLLSKQLVLDMERCDAFVACYQVLQEK